MKHWTRHLSCRCGAPRISVRAKEPDEVGPETEQGLWSLWPLRSDSPRGEKVTRVEPPFT
ncbi:hypothetical protein CCL19_11255 [Pseudomonas syringae]|nr:hypothetical protein CCL19_11255 [Pseudomonas syringae]